MTEGQPNLSVRASGAGGASGAGSPGRPGGRRGPSGPRRRQEPIPEGPEGRPEKTEGSSFEEHLRSAQGEGPEPIELSAHAKRRIAQREISLGPGQREALAEAVTRLGEKGARDAAVMRKDAAFVVNVPNRTVVTAVSEADMQDRVFTDIDSAMVL